MSIQSGCPSICNDKASINSKLPYCKCIKKAPVTEPTCDKIYRVCQQFMLTDETLKYIRNLFLGEVKKGLSKKNNDKAAVKCYITYVQDLPKGNERGKFIAMDFSSKDLRMFLCEITDSGIEMKVKDYRIPEHVLFSSGERLFNRIVEQLGKFMKEERLTRKKRFFALSFGFPLVHEDIEKCCLIKWTKGFKCSNVIGNDLVELLKDAIERKGEIDIEVCAIINDGTGLLIACAYDHKHCKISVTVSEGTNACYVEKQKNAELFKDKNRGSDIVLINTEWGAFGDDGALNFIRTYFDFDLDEYSFNRGHQIFEKMVSGHYMGELVRLILVHLTKDGLLFNSKGTTKLYTSESLASEHLYLIEEDPPGIYKNCREVLSKMDIVNPTDNDCINVRFVTECVTRRSAHLVAAALAALVNKINQRSITIAIQGSVYTNHPHYHYILHNTLKKLVKRDIKYEIVSVEYGSGKGAALLAAALSKSYTVEEI